MTGAFPSLKSQVSCGLSARPPQQPRPRRPPVDSHPCSCCLWTRDTHPAPQLSEGRAVVFHRTNALQGPGAESDPGLALKAQPGGQRAAA